MKLLPKPKSPARSALQLRVLMPSLLVLSLTGCATSSPTSPVAVAPPKNPPPPALSEPLPSRSYSVSVRETISNWRAKLTAMPTTSGP